MQQQQQQHQQQQHRRTVVSHRSSSGSAGQTSHIPPPPPPPPPPPQTSLGGGGSPTQASTNRRPAACSVCANTARYSLVLDQLQSFDAAAAHAPSRSPTSLPPSADEVASMTSSPVDTTPCGGGGGATTQQRRMTSCIGGMSALFLVVVPMAASLGMVGAWSVYSRLDWKLVCERNQIIRQQVMQIGKLIVDFNLERELTVLYAAARSVDSQAALRSGLERSAVRTDRTMAELPVWPPAGAGDGFTASVLRSPGLFAAVLDRQRSILLETGGGSGRFWEEMEFYTDVADALVGWLHTAIGNVRQYDNVRGVWPLLHAYGYLMAATVSVGAEQTLCRAFHSVVCFSRTETLAYANFSFTGEALYRLYRLALPDGVDGVLDGEDDPSSPQHFQFRQQQPQQHAEFFPGLVACRREIFDDLDHYGMAIDPSLCDYGRKNETTLHEVDRLTVVELARLTDRLEWAMSADDRSSELRYLTALAALGALSAYFFVVHVARCVWIGLRRRSGSGDKSSAAKTRGGAKRLAGRGAGVKRTATSDVDFSPLGVGRSVSCGVSSDKTCTTPLPADGGLTADSFKCNGDGSATTFYIRRDLARTPVGAGDYCCRSLKNNGVKPGLGNGGRTSRSTDVDEDMTRTVPAVENLHGRTNGSKIPTTVIDCLENVPIDLRT